MSLKLVHFIVFIITSLAFGVFSLICWNQYQELENARHMLGLCIAFGIAAVGLLLYSFWYLKKARSVIV